VECVQVLKVCVNHTRSRIF